MKYIWNVRILWTLLKLLDFAQPYYNEVTVPVSSTIQLECDDGLKIINNINVTVRRSNTTCLTTFDECTLPYNAIESIIEKCNKQVSCKVDIRDEITNHWCLQDYGYFNVWYACKTIIDNSCDFETALCGWYPSQNNYDFQWKRGRRPPNRFPKVDHTTASTAGSYVYIESNSQTDKNDYAKLESEYIIATQQQCFSFWYWKTNSRNSLCILQDEDTLLNIPENENRKWNHIQIPLNMTTHKFFKLVFEVKHERDGSGAIVIDDIIIKNQMCNSSILKCDFQSNSCGWENDDLNKYKWTKQNGEPQIFHTGPTNDHTTASDSGNYMYLDSTENTIAYLKLENVDLPVSGKFCFNFWYHMYHDEDFEMERLNVTFDNELVWTDYANTDNKWKKATIDVHSRHNMSIKFIGILGRNVYNDIDIALDDISLAEGTCKDYSFHEDICVQMDEQTPKETECPKGYLRIANSDVLFDPEKEECSKTYNLTKHRLLGECKDRDDSEKCLIDLSTDKSTHPECFQLYDFHIIHTCEDEEPTTVSPVITSKGYSSSDQKSTTVSSDITSRETSEGLTVGLVIGASLLVCAVLVIIILIRRHTWSNPREKIKNNIGENDYIGSQDIALPLAANHSRHMQNTGKYNGSSDTSLRANAHNNTVHHDYTNVGAVNGLVNDDVQVPTYARRQDKTFADNHMPKDDEYAVVDPTAETSFNKTTYNKTGTAGSYMVLDPTQTGFNRHILSNTPVGYEFAKPVHDTENKFIEDDQYAISDGVYDHSGNNRHKESENNIYSHTVDTIYDSGSHKRNDEGREDTYDHFFGQTTEDDYDISTTT